MNRLFQLGWRCTRRGHRNNIRRVPRVEVLEDRTLPAQIAWDGGGDGFSWNDPANWSENQLPGAGDDVTVNVAGDLTVRVNGTPAPVRSLTNFETIYVEGNESRGGAAHLQVQGDLTNRGTIRLETTREFF